MPSSTSDLPAAQEETLVRVLFAINLDPRLKFGSMEEQIFILARAFKREGGLFLPLFNVPLGDRVAARYAGAGLQAEWANLNEFNPRRLRHLIGLIRGCKIEIVHWNFYHPLNRYVWALSVLQPKLRHYFTDHNSRDMNADGLPINPSPVGWKRLAKKLLLRRYDRVICISEFVRQNLASQGTWSNLSCCTHFINTDRFTPDLDARARLRGDLDVARRFVVLVVSQLIREKGVAVVLKALTRLSDRTGLWVIGHGAEAENLKGLSLELSLNPRVTFFGWQTDVSPYMQATDCLVVPSIWGEAAGLVILEGLACGLPVIASRVGGIPEFIEDGKTGFLFPAGDDESLARILRHLEAEPETCRKVGARARASAVERFSVQARLPDYLEMYRR